MQSLILPAVQFALLLAFLGYKLKTPFRNFMTQRHLDVTSGLNRSKTQAANAEAKRKEIEVKLSQLTVEKQKIVAEWKEKEALQLKTLKESSQRLLNQMKTEAEQNKKGLEEFYRKAALKSIGMLIVTQAEAKIKANLNGDSHRRINDQFSKEIVGA